MSQDTTPTSLFRPRLALVPGEPAGIGPELCVRAAQRHWDADLICYGDRDTMLNAAEAIGLPLKLISPNDPSAVGPGRLAHVEIPKRDPVVFGRPMPRNARTTIGAMETAAGACLRGLCDGLVTGPVHKAAINEGGIPYTGTTELLAQQAGCEVVMMLANDIVRVALATTHLPLRAVADAINADGLERTLRIVYAALRDDFGIAEPRIAVLGLNPHAGEDGHLGREELDLIIPLLDKLRAEGMRLLGPLAGRHCLPTREVTRHRRGPRDVSRPRAAGTEIQRFRARGEPHPRLALSTRRGRSRHCVGTRRQGHRRPRQPLRRDRHLHPSRTYTRGTARTHFHGVCAMSRRDHDAADSQPLRSDATRFEKPAKKSLGQHFLHERGVIDKMLLAIDPKPGERFVEIGPGQGALTFPLLDRHGALTAIEFDRDLLAPLTAAAQAHGALTLIHSDVMNVDFGELAAQPPGGQIRLVGNLPYNLSSPILFHALDHAAAIRDMHFMLQKEVVDRMAAAPGSKVYGRLSVMLQAYCRVTGLFNVAPGAFRPPPKVDSAVVRLVPKAASEIGVDDPKRFAAVVRAAFGQRRKTLRNALSSVCTSEEILAAGIDPQSRAEQLAVADFVRLANATPQR